MILSGPYLVLLRQVLLFGSARRSDMVLKCFTSCNAAVRFTSQCSVCFYVLFRYTNSQIRVFALPLYTVDASLWPLSRIIINLARLFLVEVLQGWCDSRGFYSSPYAHLKALFRGRHFCLLSGGSHMVIGRYKDIRPGVEIVSTKGRVALHR